VARLTEVRPLLTRYGVVCAPDVAPTLRASTRAARTLHTLRVHQRSVLVAVALVALFGGVAATARTSDGAPVLDERAPGPPAIHAPPRTTANAYVPSDVCVARDAHRASATVTRHPADAKQRLAPSKVRAVRTSTRTTVATTAGPHSHRVEIDPNATIEPYP